MKMNPTHFIENNGFIRISGRTNVLCVILTHPLKSCSLIIYNTYIMKKRAKQPICTLVCKIGYFAAHNLQWRLVMRRPEWNGDENMEPLGDMKKKVAHYDICC